MPLKRILLITDGFFHPPLFARLILRRMFQTMPGFAFTHIASFEELPNSPNLDGVGAVVVYLHHRTVSPRALQVFDHFVLQGGGVVAIHSATASFKETPHYFEILGGRFIGHGPVESFEVLPVAGVNEPFERVPGFTIRDELYLHEFQPGVQVHYQAIHEGARIPVVWTCRYGAGKVCYAAPGHLAQTMRHPTFRQILKRGLTWASA